MEGILESLGGPAHPCAEAYRNLRPADDLGGVMDDGHRQIARDAPFASLLHDSAAEPKTIPSKDAVRALAFFLHGSNNVLVPRGLFVDSKLYVAFDSPYEPNSPSANATVYGNGDGGSAHLNARVVQMAVAKAFLLTAFPFVLAEVATGVASWRTGLLGIPPWFDAGTVVDVGILAAGIAVALFRMRGQTYADANR